MSDVSLFLKRIVCGQLCPDLVSDTEILGISNSWAVSASSYFTFQRVDIFNLPLSIWF